MELTAKTAYKGSGAPDISVRPQDMHAHKEKIPRARQQIPSRALAELRNTY